MAGNLDHALRYAALGIPVFPVHYPKGDKCSCGKPDCPNIGKHPICRNGRDDATTDVEQITKWWTVNPSANIGAATGGEWFVIDADGSEGMQEFAELTLEVCDSMPEGPVVATGGGGSHSWFRKPAEVPVKTTTRLAGHSIDIRAEGGYAILPPSVHASGTVYKEFVPFDVDIPECRPLLDWVLSSTGGNGHAEVSSTSTNGKPGPMRVQAESPDFATCPGVASGQRHATAVTYAARQFGRGEGGAKVLADALAWNERLRLLDQSEPLPEDELVRIVTDIERKDRQPAETSGVEVSDSGKLVIPDITSAEFDQLEIDHTYLVDGVLTKGEPCVVGGFMKTMKTSVAVDLAMSLGCGRKFLNQFWSTRSRVGIVSGESGQHTLQETARRVCRSKGVSLADADVFWHFVVPCITDPAAQLAVVEWIERRELDVVVIDPLYLAFAGVDTAKYATNVLAMGSMFRDFARVVESTGVTLVIVHHISRTAHRARGFEPADLSDLAMAGLAEFARSWIMLSRRGLYVPGSGDHQLWMSTGGSAGHGGLFGLDVSEGTRKDAGGRRWDVAVLQASDVRSESIDQRDEARRQKRKAENQKVRDRVLKALRAKPEGETANPLKTPSGVGIARLREILADMLDDGDIIECEVIKNNRPESGFKLP